MSQLPQKDKWQELLDKELENLKTCQQSKNINSCMKCQSALECEVRETYVKAVYESMNKGSGGGFEF
jgi:hypothetical protein